MQTPFGWAAIEGAYQTPASDPIPYRIYAFANADTVPLGKTISVNNVPGILSGTYVRGELDYYTMFGTQKQPIYDPLRYISGGR